MDKYRSASDVTHASNSDEASVAAESIRSDFSDLVSLLDQQTANLGVTDEAARSHLLEARAAAERGLELSMQLIELLRAAT